MNSKEILKQIREESDDLDREVKMSRKDFVFSLWMASRLPESEIVEWANLGMPIVFVYDPPIETPAPVGRKAVDIRPETADERNERQRRLIPFGKFILQSEVVEAYRQVRKIKSKRKEPSDKRAVLLQVVRTIKERRPDSQVDEEDLNYVTDFIDRLFPG